MTVCVGKNPSLPYKEMLPEMELGLTKAMVRRIVNKLPLSDSIACLDFMLRNMWDGEEYRAR